MNDPLVQVLFWSGLTTVANLAGIYALRALPRRGRGTLLLFTAFGGGVVIGTAFLHLLPEALARRADAGAYAGLAFLALYFFESHIRHRHHGGILHATAHGAIPRGAAHGGGCAVDAAHTEARVLAIVTATAFALHSVTDGLALAVTARASPEISLETAIAVLAHEAPEGFAVFSLLLYGGLSLRAATRYAWFVALVTPTAALAAFGALGDVTEAQSGLLLGAVAGSMLYIGATEILPEIRREGRWRTTFAVVAGALVALVVGHVGHVT